jgi:hypothetical protein
VTIRPALTVALRATLGMSAPVAVAYLRNELSEKRFFRLSFKAIREQVPKRRGAVGADAAGSGTRGTKMGGGWSAADSNP